MFVGVIRLLVGYSIRRDGFQTAEVVLQPSSLALCIKDVAVREDVLYVYVGCGAELLAETESQVDVCAEAYSPVVILKKIIGVEVCTGVAFEPFVAVEYVVHGKRHTDGLFIGDGAGDIGFRTHDVFFDVAYHEVVLPLVEQQIGFGTESERHILTRGAYPKMYVARNKFLLAGDGTGQGVEVALVELPGNVHIDFVEGVYVIHAGMGAIVEGVPLPAVARQVQFAIHAIHAECQVEAVFGRQGEQIVGAYIEVAVVPISQTCIAGLCFRLRLFPGIGLHDACGDLGCRHQGGVVFHRLLADGRRFYFGEHVYFGGIHDVRVVFLFHDYRTVHGGVLGLCLGLCFQREHREGDSCKDVCYLFHIFHAFYVVFIP